MKRRQRYGDITIHSKAYVGGVLRGKYPHQREPFLRYAGRRARLGIRRFFAALAAPFLLLAGLLGGLLLKLTGPKRHMAARGFSYSPLYTPPPKIDDDAVARRDKRRRLELPLVVSACVIAPVAAFLIAFALMPKPPEAREVYLYDNGVTTAFRTESSTVGEFLQGVTRIASADIVLGGAAAPIEPGMVISVKRAFPVTVTSRQKTKVLDMAGGTVEDALDALSIAVRAGDIITPSPETKLMPGMQIEHIAVEVLHETEIVKLPFKKEVKKDATLVKGKTKLKTEGKSGSKEVATRIELRDGAEFSREVVSETVLSKPVNQVMLEGTAAPPAPAKKPAPLRNDTRSSNKKGLPKKSQIKKEIVIEATAYTHTGNPTAMGTMPKVGTVAVNPKLIPYGTKLYIEGYGYGVAEDTGGFVYSNDKPAIDLFMETVKECINWGRKSVKVYILK